MPKHNMKCRVCGNTYYMCATCSEVHNKTMFMRRSVSCSDECFIKFIKTDIIVDEKSGGDTMKVSLNDNKVYEVESVNYDKKTMKLNGYKDEVSKDDIKGFAWLPTDDVGKIADFLKESKKNKLTKEK